MESRADSSYLPPPVIQLVTYFPRPGWILFAAGMAFSVSFCNYAIFALVLLPFIVKTDLTRQAPLYRTPLDMPFAALYASMVVASLGSYAAGGTDFVKRSFLWTVTYTAPVVYYTICYALPEQPRRLWRVLPWALFAAAAANSAFALYQFGDALARGKDLYTVRPSGRMFYMTYGGVMMSAITFAVAMLLRGRLRARAKVALIALTVVMAAGLAASLVRSAWVGLAVAIFVLAVVADKRLLWAFPTVAVVAFLVAPRPIIHRAASIVNAATADEHGETEGPPEFRVDIWRTTLRIAKDFPVAGVGLHNTIYLYDKYKDAGSIESQVPHAHNNYIQIVVERGVVGLAAFVYFFYSLLRLFARGYHAARSAEGRVVGLAGLGVTAGFLVAGFFEYTFGDYEIMVFIYALAAGMVITTRDDAAEDIE